MIRRALTICAGLLTAFALGQRLVTTEMVLEVCREFDIEETRVGDRPAAKTATAPVLVRAATLVPEPSVAAEPADNRMLVMQDAGAPGPSRRCPPANR